MSKTSTEPRRWDAGLARLPLSGPAMGSRWSAVVHVPPDFDTMALGRDLAGAVEEVEAEMSNWRPTSDVERLNRAPIGEWVSIPSGLLTVLEAALAIGRSSGGLFDVGVGDLVRAFGFGGGSRSPDAERIAATAGRPGFDPPATLDLDPVNRRARRLAPLTIDLAGIAKGHAVDRMAEVAAGHGVASFLVGIDGELKARGRKPDGRPWIIGRERPDRESRSLSGVIELTDAAVATSGNYRHIHEIAGREMSHTMDPRTGAPLVGDLAQVTVIAESCMVADAWATALMVAGAERGSALARRMGLAAILIPARGSTVSSKRAISITANHRVLAIGIAEGNGVLAARHEPNADFERALLLRAGPDALPGAGE
ncbi:MAG: FAD:protein FMN transferase [Siculibacillus sp.]|nr:FAD:protein FMN transferase [Siculibacillus sp.]